MPTSFDNPKSLRFQITLATGTFGSSNNNQVTFEGLRATVEIEKAGGVQNNTLHARIYGVSQSNMNSLTVLQYQADQLAIVSNSAAGTGGQQRDDISVWAIDGRQETLIFMGKLSTAWGNYQNQPDVFLELQAISGLASQLSPVPPTSVKGTIDCATLMGTLATQMGYTFENNGVSGVTLSNPYLPNTALEQARALAHEAGCWLYLDPPVIAIVPPYTPRSTPVVPEISPQSGLVGYPTFGSGYGGPSICFQTLFNPAITFGGQIQVVSSLQRACGSWIVNSIAHSLDSEKPGGRWFSTVAASKTKLVSG
jgi:hypothetical protein